MGIGNGYRYLQVVFVQVRGMGIGICICITKSIDNGYFYRCIYVYAIYCWLLLFMYISIGIDNGYW